MADRTLDHWDARAIHFRVESKLGKYIGITRQYWQHIVTVKHPSIAGKEKEVERTLQNPHIIRRSKVDTRVFLYYRKRKAHYICVVVRHRNSQGFIITAYITDKIKEGELVWSKRNKK